MRKIEANQKALKIMCIEMKLDFWCEKVIIEYSKLEEFSALPRNKKWRLSIILSLIDVETATVISFCIDLSSSS